MADDVIDLTRERFNRVDAKLDRILNALDTITARLSSLEEQIALQRRDLIRVEHRIDGMDRRLAKIEKRLDLVQA